MEFGFLLILLLTITKRTCANDDISEGNKNFTVKYYLYTNDNSNTPQELSDGDTEVLKKSNFDPANPTRFVCHGWMANYTSRMNQEIREKYLSLGNYNMIHIDWSEAAYEKYLLASYKTAAAGKSVANFIEFLRNKGNLDLDRTYLIGFSLGAHIMGIAGKHQKSNKKINTIFGLEPASPVFSYYNHTTRLAKGDARYVESIVTDGAIRSFLRPVGNAQFYPNFGRNQPGCSGNLLSLCSHNRVISLFVESLDKDNQFFAKKCKDFYGNIVNEHSCRGTQVQMGGEPSNFGKTVRGLYYLSTNSKSPYAKGRTG